MLCVVVWGDAFLERFCRLSLPCYLSKENVPKLAQENDVSLVIYTDAETSCSIEKYQAIQILKKIIQVEINIIKIDKEIAKYESMSNCHQKVLRKAKIDDIIVFLNPDVIFSKKYLSSVVNHINNKTDAVFVHNFRINLEDVFFDLEKQISKDGCLTLQETDLVKLAIRNIHDSSKHIFWNERGSGYASWHICCKKGENFISNTFHPHPAAIRVKKYVSNFSGSIDHELPVLATRGINFFKTLKDSDDGVLFELSPRSYNPFIDDNYEAVLIEPNPEKAAIWVEKWANPHHLELVKETVMFHAESKKKSRNLMDKEKKMARDIIFSIVQSANNKNKYTNIISNIRFRKKVESIFASPRERYLKENLLDICYSIAKNKALLFSMEKERLKELKSLLRNAFEETHEKAILEKVLPGGMKRFIVKLLYKK